MTAPAPKVRGADGAGGMPDLREVYEIIRTNAAGVDEAQLNTAAVKGLISALAPRVRLVSPAQDGKLPASALVIKTNVFDGTIAYLRIGQVSEGLADVVVRNYEALRRSSKVQGLVLDLRYSGGEDYAAAAEVGGLVITKERPVLDWGAGMHTERPSVNGIKVPVAVLVNRETSGASEALSAMLRQVGAGLILGGTTAGQALVTRDFPLQNGDRLRVATGQIRLGDGTALDMKGISPDIAVQVSPSAEKSYYADAFTLLRTNAAPGLVMADGTTNMVRRPRNEAELVRERREGINGEVEEPRPRRLEPPKPVVHDPALARALDLLKGLAVVRGAQS